MTYCWTNICLLFNHSEAESEELNTEEEGEGETEEEEGEDAEAKDGEEGETKEGETKEGEEGAEKDKKKEVGVLQLFLLFHLRYRSKHFENEKNNNYTKEKEKYFI